MTKTLHVVLQSYAWKSEGSHGGSHVTVQKEVRHAPSAHIQKRPGPELTVLYRLFLKSERVEDCFLFAIMRGARGLQKLAALSGTSTVSSCFDFCIRTLTSGEGLKDVLADKIPRQQVTQLDRPDWDKVCIFRSSHGP